jgi:hypothetical protein
LELDLSTSVGLFGIVGIPRRRSGVRAAPSNRIWLATAVADSHPLPGVSFAAPILFDHIRTRTNRAAISHEHCSRIRKTHPSAVSIGRFRHEAL